MPVARKSLTINISGANDLDLVPAPGRGGGFGPSRLVLDWITGSWRGSGANDFVVQVIEDPASTVVYKEEGRLAASGTLAFEAVFDKNGPFSSGANPRVEVTGSGTVTNLEVQVGYHYE
jgi:hypothetical protein